MGSLAPLAASSLLELAVRATILLSVALALAWLARRGPARVRHLLWTMTFALLLGLPVFSFLGLSWEVPILRSGNTATEQRFSEIPPIQAGADGVITLPASEPLLPLAASTRQVPVGEPESPGRSIPRPLLLWAVGCAIGLTSLVLGGVRFARLVRTASPVRDPVLIRQAEALRQRLGIHSDVRLLVSQATTTPMTGGLLRRVILFPASAAEWSPERWKVVLMHEMVHVRRRDVLRHLMGRTVLALYWFHPLSWVATMLAASASEEACDQEVLTLGTRPSEYAAHLLALAGSTSARRPVLTLPMSQQSHSQLERRIMAILTPFRPGRSGIGTALMVTVLSGTGASAAIVHPVQQRNLQIDETPLLTIGDDADEALHGVVAAVLTDDVLILAEVSTHSLRFYNRRTGALIRAAGQRGEGPGDFGNLSLLQAVGDRLYTFDSWLRRVTVWTLDGEVERTVRIQPWGDHNAFNIEGFFPDGSMLVSGWADAWAEEPMIFRDERQLARLDTDGNFIGVLGGFLGSEYYSSPESRKIYSHRRITWPIVTGGRYHIVDNKDPVIRAFDMAGNPAGELAPHTVLSPQPLTSAARDSLPELEGIDRDAMPRFYPFYTRPRSAGGMLWVPDYDGFAPNGGTAWTLYSQRGDIIGRVGVPEPNFNVMAVEGDTAAVMIIDELGVQRVELRRIIGLP